MVARYAEYQAMTVDAVDGVMSEDIRHHPLIGKIADPGRPQLVFNAVARIGATEVRNMQGGRAGEWDARLSAGGGEIHVAHWREGQGADDLWVPALARDGDGDVTISEPDPGLFIRKGDRVRLIDRPGQPFFDVLSITRRQSGRAILHLGDA